MKMAMLCLILAAGSALAENSWLPEKPVPTEPATVAELLKSLSGSCRALACQYNGNKLASTTPFVAGKAEAAGARWSCDLHATKADDDALNLTATFKVIRGAATQAGVAVAFDFSNWSPKNYVHIPGLVYGGNRFRIVKQSYKPFLHTTEGSEIPITTTDIAHLQRDGSHGKIELRSGNVAVPMMSFFNPSAKQGFLVMTTQESRLGDNGLMIEEDAGPETKSKRISFVFSAPCVRTSRLIFCQQVPSKDHGANWKAGDEVVLRFRVSVFNAEKMEDFYEKTFAARKALAGPTVYRNLTPFSACTEVICAKADQQFWFTGRKVPDHYSERIDDNHPFWKYASYMFGWCGNPMESFHMFLAKTPERMRRVSSTLDFVMTGENANGLFHAASSADGRFYGDNRNNPSDSSIVTIRRTADVLYITLLMCEIAKRRGDADWVKPEWEQKMKAAADALVKVWEENHQFGKNVDVYTMKITLYGTTAGACAGSALAVASRYFNEPKYLQVAEDAMKMYYERDLLKGYSGGGSSDILMDPDTETVADMVESCMVLYDVTGKQEWVDRAKFASRMYASWVFPYDFRFPKGSDSERAGDRTTGAYICSAQNAMAAMDPLYMLSGDMLLKLFRATGDTKTAELYKDNVHNLVQYVAAPHHPTRKDSGAIGMNMNTSEILGKIGKFRGEATLRFGAMAAMKFIQNPGIYLHTDDETLLVLDHVEAKILKRDATGVTLSLTNATPYDAEVKIFAETAAQAKKPLDRHAFLDWPKVKIKKGETKTVMVLPTGLIKSRD